MTTVFLGGSRAVTRLPAAVCEKLDELVARGCTFVVGDATGADDPYDKLKRALRAEVDEAAWSSLYSTTGRPFDRPKSGRIAVKVINHYGDEVLKVFTVN